MSHKQVLIYVVVFLFGVVAADRVRTLPVVGNKIPSV